MGRFRLSIASLAAAAVLALALSACGSGDEAPSAVAGTSSPMEQAALAKYRSFLSENADELVNWTTQLRGQIAADELEKAQSRYATSRVHYSQIEVALQTLAKLDGRINARTGDVPGDKFGGFHKVEEALFANGAPIVGLAAAKQLLKDVETVAAQLKAVKLEPAEVANDAREIVKEISESKLDGAEERYSHVDLVDISANLEGARAAFEAVKPLLVSEEDNALAKKVEADFDDVFEVLKTYGIPGFVPQSRPAAAGSSFTPYDEVPGEFVYELTESMSPLVEQMKEVPARVEAIESE